MYKTDVTEKESREVIMGEERNPHQTIADFFCVSRPKNTKRFLDYLFYGYSRKKEVEYTPGAVVYLYEELVKLLENCWIIRELGLKEKSAIADSRIFENGVEWMDADLFCVDYDRGSAWNNFPRSLSKKEFINPYIVFKKVFKFTYLSDWKERLNSVLYASLSGHKCPVDHDINVFLMKNLLEKLTDATYLIYSRALSREKEDTVA